MILENAFQRQNKVEILLEALEKESLLKTQNVQCHEKQGNIEEFTIFKFQRILQH